jgi:hypothetical protein
LEELDALHRQLQLHATFTPITACENNNNTNNNNVANDNNGQICESFSYVTKQSADHNNMNESKKNFTKGILQAIGICLFACVNDCISIFIFYVSGYKEFAPYFELRDRIRTSKTSKKKDEGVVGAASGVCTGDCQYNRDIDGDDDDDKRLASELQNSVEGLKRHTRKYARKQWQWIQRLANKTPSIDIYRLNASGISAKSFP